MSGFVIARLDTIDALTAAATPGPWEPGDVWSVAGVVAKFYGPGRCASCNYGEPVWTGRTDINGRVMQAHRHRDPDPYEPDHHISGANGGTVAGNYDVDRGGILDPDDTAFICAARTEVPALVAAVRGVLVLCDRDLPAVEVTHRWTDDDGKPQARHEMVGAVRVDLLRAELARHLGDGAAT